MIVRDYNGTGRWSAEAIRQRYADYAQRLNLSNLRDLTPSMHEEQETRWIYPVMERVIEGIEAHDPACTMIGIEFIEEDEGFAFGRTLKSNAARALRRAPLTPPQAQRIRERVVAMLIAGNVPHEYKEYAKLLRQLGVSPVWQRIEDEVDRGNRRALRFYEYFKKVVTQNESKR
ncbi:MAG: hypothetical protein L0Y44_06460 [Phycisphaerales bacterium]|nr:hypothetical protein [Phycisphaerales bacterium]